MGQPLIDLQGQGVWTQVFDERREAAKATDTVYLPIPAFEIGFSFESHILAVRCLSTTAKAHWRFAGNLSQRFQIGTGGTASPLPVVTASRLSMRLNRADLVRFPALTAAYELLFEPPHWLKDLRLTVWQYSGSESDTTEELIEAARVDLIRIEHKIDALNY